MSSRRCRIAAFRRAAAVEYSVGRCRSTCSRTSLRKRPVADGIPKHACKAQPPLSFVDAAKYGSSMIVPLKAILRSSVPYVAKSCTAIVVSGDGSPPPIGSGGKIGVIAASQSQNIVCFCAASSVTSMVRMRQHHKFRQWIPAARRAHAHSASKLP